MSELISKIGVSPVYRGSFTNQIARILSGEIGEIELRAMCKDLNRERLQQFIDELNGEACLYCVGMTGVPRDELKAEKLFNVVKLLEELQGGGYQNSQVGGGVSQPVDFPQEKQVDTTALPEQFKSPQAITYWQKLYEANFVTKDCKPLGTKKQMALIAAEFSRVVGWRPIYKPFANLWGEKSNSMQVLASKARTYDNKEIWYQNIVNIFKS